jgi:hypothetical protein
VTNPAVVQFANTSGHGTPGSLTLGSTPTAGNLIIAFIFTDGDANAVLDTTKWTDVAHGTGATRHWQCVRRYVQSGDTTALPAFCSSGSFFYSTMAYEISGVTGTWATDFDQSTAGYGISHPSHTVTTTSMSTAVANELAVIGNGDYNATQHITVSSGWTQDIDQLNFSNYGAWTGVHQSFVSASSTVQTTFTNNDSSYDAGYIAVLIRPAGSTFSDSVSESSTLADTPDANATMATSEVESVVVLDGYTASDTDPTSVSEFVTLLDTPTSNATTAVDVSESVVSLDVVDANVSEGAHGNVMVIFMG